MGGSGFARDGHVKRVGEAGGHAVGVSAAAVAQARARTRLGDALQQAHHGVGHLGAEHFARGRTELVEDHAVGVFDAQDDDGLGVEPLVAKGRVGADELKNAHVDSSEGDRRHDRNVGLHAQVLGELGDRRWADLLHQVGRDGVDRAREGLLQGQHAAVLVVGVAGAPGFRQAVLASFDAGLDVGHLHAGRELFVGDGGGVDKRLKR